MNYKKVFKSRKTREKILRVLSFVPDELMLKIQYRIKLGRSLNLKNPKRYTEKLQWYKLYYWDAIMTDCVDKYEVRTYIKDCGLEEILNECYGVFSSPQEIDLDKLPDAFVLKDTMGSGGNSVIIVQDKKTVNWTEICDMLQEWVDVPINEKHMGREKVYSQRKHRIIVEKLLKLDESGDLPDYKFFCFNGEIFCSYMMENYTMHHSEGRMGFFDRDFNLLPVCRKDFEAIKEQPNKPKNYEKMIEIAESLSKRFPHVRVDLYNINGEIFFGELTFFNASGYMEFEPDEFDYMIGDKFILPEKSNGRR